MASIKFHDVMYMYSYIVSNDLDLCTRVIIIIITNNASVDTVKQRTHWNVLLILPYYHCMASYTIATYTPTSRLTSRREI